MINPFVHSKDDRQLTIATINGPYYKEVVWQNLYNRSHPYQTIQRTP